MRTIINCLVAFLILGLTVDIISQEMPEVVPGSLVRISAPDRAIRKLVGTVVTFDSDTLVLREKGSATQLAFSVASLTQLEVSQGRKSRFVMGASYGLLVGAGAGYFLGSAGCEVGTCPRPSIVIGGVVGGFLIGAIIGNNIEVERWEYVFKRH